MVVSKFVNHIRLSLTVFGLVRRTAEPGIFTESCSLVVVSGKRRFLGGFDSKGRLWCIVVRLKEERRGVEVSAAQDKSYLGVIDQYRGTLLLGVTK